jgi:hypoxanthine phosphoribosyltransferase
VLLGVLKGSFIFLADLARAISRPVRVEFLGVQSYGNETKSSGAVQITLDISAPIDGSDVIIVEDIVDTGLTAHFLMQQLAARRARSVRLCSLLHKPAGAQRQVQIDYLGFTIDNVFVIGYGLDWAQKYRNLPDICIIDS